MISIFQKTRTVRKYLPFTAGNRCPPSHSKLFAYVFFYKKLLLYRKWGWYNTTFTSVLILFCLKMRQMLPNYQKLGKTKLSKNCQFLSIYTGWAYKMSFLLINVYIRNWGQKSKNFLQNQVWSYKWSFLYRVQTDFYKKNLKSFLESLYDFKYIFPECSSKKNPYTVLIFL